MDLEKEDLHQRVLTIDKGVSEYISVMIGQTTIT